MSTHCEKSFSTTLECIRKSTAQDEQLTRLKGYINTGLPSERRTCQQIFMIFGCTRKWSALSQASLLAGPGS